MSSGPATHPATTLPAQAAAETGSSSATNTTPKARNLRSQRPEHTSRDSPLPGPAQRFPGSEQRTPGAPVLSCLAALAWTAAPVSLDSHLDNSRCPVHLSTRPTHTPGDHRP